MFDASAPQLPADRRGSPWRAARPRRDGLAREHGSGYDAESVDRGISPARRQPDGPTNGSAREARAERGEAGPEAGPTIGDAARREVPFGLPVLGELPDLAGVLESVARADGLLVGAVLRLASLLDGQIEETTGVGVEHWLAATARMARLDRRLLRRMCRLLDRLPALAAGAADGKLSFTQLRALTLELHAAPRSIDEPLDAWLDSALSELPDDVDPDVLVRQAAKAVDELIPQLLDQQTEDVAHYSRSLVIQPNLQGTGGTFSGTEDAVGLAVLDAVTAPRRDQLDDVARARADNLQQRLRHGCSDLASPVVHEFDGKNDAEAGGDGAEAVGSPPAADAAVEAEVGAADPGVGGPVELLASPKLLLRWDFDALMNRTAAPAHVLTRLVGGKLRMTSEYAARLTDARGAEVRSIIVDDGKVIGVGRGTRVPPDWLRDTVLALHDTCTEPLCDRPAALADVDHAIGWTPTGDNQLGGPTDLDNLGPLCGRPNRDKQASGWRTTQTVYGRRTWQHPRSGLTISTVPATWRPPGAPPRPRKHHHRAPPPGGRDDPPRPPPDALPF